MNLLRYFLNFAFSCPAAAFGMGALNKHTYSKDELFQETEQHRRLGGIRHRFGSLPAHNGTDRQFVGLHGIYRHILQTRSGPPSRSASFHDSGTNIHAVLFRKSGKRGHDGQCHVEYSQRIHDSVPVLDHNASARKIFAPDSDSLTKAQTWTVIGAGIIERRHTHLPTRSGSRQSKAKSTPCPPCSPPSWYGPCSNGRM